MGWKPSPEREPVFAQEKIEMRMLEAPSLWQIVKRRLILRIFPDYFLKFA